jgi:3-hydroxyacyl-[acyl-carrier-protein] dehydratase
VSLAAEARACVEQASLEGASLHARVCFPARLSVFAGHFPGQPVVPGVYLIEALAEAVGRTRGEELRVIGVRTAKFLRPLVPGECVRVEGTLLGDFAEAQSTELDVDARLSCEGDLVATLSLRLGLTQE